MLQFYFVAFECRDSALDAFSLERLAVFCCHQSEEDRQAAPFNPEVLAKLFKRDGAVGDLKSAFLCDPVRRGHESVQRKKGR